MTMTNDTPPRDDALLPCPFCGNPSAYYGASVRCTSFSCNASMSPRWTKDVVGSAKGDVDARLALAKADTTLRWNARRADQPARVGVKPLDDIDVQGWAAFKGHALPTAIARYIAEQANAALLPTEAQPVQNMHQMDMGDGRILTSKTAIPEPIDYRGGTNMAADPDCVVCMGDGTQADGETPCPCLATPPAASPDAALVEVLMNPPMVKHAIGRDTPDEDAWRDLMRKAAAALSTRPAPQAVTVQDILNALREAMQHDQGGIDYSEAVGIPISNSDELRAEVKFYERAIKFIEARALAGERG